MNNIEFAKISKQIATEYKTLYVLGCFGAPLNNTNKKRYTNNYEYNRRSVRKDKILSSSSDTFGFDCVCLIKGILWGWNGNKNQTYGGAKYKSNNVPDVGADQIIKYCTSVSTNFDIIEIGEIVHIKGHVGIYVGSGLVAECTPIWKDGVQLTALLNINAKSGYNGRTWKEHGKLKFVEYTSNSNQNPNSKTIEEIAKEVISGLWDNGKKRKEKLTNAGYNYEEVQKKVNEMLNSNSNIGIDYYPKSNYKGNSIVDALKELGINSSFKNRLKIANKNGIKLYFGTSNQNTKLLNLLKNGKLKK